MAFGFLRIAGDRIVRLGVSPRVQRHLYQARAMRNKLEELKKRRREATSALDNEKLAGNSIEKLRLLTEKSVKWSLSQVTSPVMLLIRVTTPSCSHDVVATFQYTHSGIG